MMQREILMNVSPAEMRVALLENGTLQELSIERQQRRGTVGNIYKGKVARVLPGMQAAFVDVGLERAAFIHVDDIHSGATPGAQQVALTGQPRTIETILAEGQPIVVQVAKDMIGTKGARLTTYLSMPSRFVVLMPFAQHIGVSQRIEDDAERERLKGLLEEILGERNEELSVGLIVRTAAEGVEKQALADDVAFILRLWKTIEQRGNGASAPNVIYRDLPLHLRTLRDMCSSDVERIRIDAEWAYADSKEFMESFLPEAANRLERYDSDRPLFEMYGIEEEITRAMSRSVPLKSGGSIVIDPTEAMTTIDVNTGGFVGRKTLGETIYKTNLEAAQAIARQIRLRNIGGIIIVDFIDMEDDEHQRQVMRLFQKHLENDYAKTNITAVSELGLVEMTRKRTRQSLAQILCETCPTCDGRGVVRTAETICNEIFREIIRENKLYEAESFLVVASQSVIDRLLDEDSSFVADLEALTAKPIRMQMDSQYSPEQFDVVWM